MVFAEQWKCSYFYKKIWRFLQQNLTSFVWMRIIMIKNTSTSWEWESADFTAKIIKFSQKIVKRSCKDHQTFMQKSSEFPGKPVKFSCKLGGFSWENRQMFLQKSSLFSQKESNFLSKIVKIFLLKLSTFPRKIGRMHSTEWFQKTSIITRFKKF